MKRRSGREVIVRGDRRGHAPASIADAVPNEAGLGDASALRSLDELLARHRQLLLQELAEALAGSASLSTTYLTAKEAAVYLRFSTVRAFYEWVRRHGITKLRKGRRVLFLRRDLDDALRRYPGARRKLGKTIRKEE